ncbi:MAG: helix-turn-helix transcriptional regulator [Candidatus Zixiibacteriota bacterium]|nr:MAG: helix-turn-helix transcriptional regulator [candidate division Zixibacteria bacterium]
MKFSKEKFRKCRQKKFRSEGKAAAALRKLKLKDDEKYPTRSTVHAWEDGSNSPTINVYEACAKVFEVDLSEFFDFDGTEPIFEEFGNRIDGDSVSVEKGDLEAMTEWKELYFEQKENVKKLEAEIEALKVGVANPTLARSPKVK